jgi:hypothetical protein
MREIIVFQELDGDPILELEVDYHFSIGDEVYYLLTEAEKDKIKDFYSNSDIGGMIIAKWINLTTMVIKWYVDVDFVRCDNIELK